MSPDTQAILLLCGRFGKARDSEFKPLEPREYYALAAWLEGQVAVDNVAQAGAELASRGLTV